jgi:hypothetical protein
MGGREGRGMEECGEYERLEKQNGVAEFGGRMVFVTYAAIGSMLCLDMMHSVAEKAPCRRRSKKVGLLRARAPACLVLAQTTKPCPNYKLGSNPGPTSASAPAGTTPPLLSLCTSAHTLRIITTHHVHRYSPLRIPLPLPPTQTTPPAAPATTTPTPNIRLAVHHHHPHAQAVHASMILQLQALRRDIEDFNNETREDLHELNI